MAGIYKISEILQENYKLKEEVILLRKVADAARAYLKGGYNETLDELVLTVLELDKEVKKGGDVD